MYDRLEFHARAKYEMTKRGMTLKQLAKKLGVSIGYTADIIKGNRQGGNYKEEIANILGIDFPKEESIKEKSNNERI